MTGGSRPNLVRWALLAACTWAATAAAQPNVDPDVIRAQQLGMPVLPPPNVVPDSPDRTPTGTTVPTGVTTTPGRGTAPVVDPPPPQVQLQVRALSHVPVGKPVAYKVTVANTSPAKALRVKVKMPAPEGAAAMTRCEPLPDGQKGPLPPQGVQPMELVWTLPSLNKGETKTFDLEFLPAAGGKQVSATAYVSFEYGARVETTIDTPKVTVKKTATPQVTAGELATVRVEVTNPGKVAVPDAVLKEQVPADVEIRGDADAEKTSIGGQRAWKLGTIAAGQTKVVTYQLLPRNDRDLKTLSFVTSGPDALDHAPAETTTKVLVPALRLDFTGPPTAGARGAAVYTATVRNAGTLPLENVRLTVDVPADLNVVKVTNGCRTPRNDQDRERVWVIPKLPAGESQEFRLSAEPGPGISGRRTIKATVREGRGKLEDQTRDATTDFVGRADLTWKPSFDAARVAIGRQGTLTVTVKNQGSETDKGVRVRVSIPPEVKIVDVGPKNAALTDNAVQFPPQALAPGKTVEFTVTYEGRTAGQARFALMLEGESLGDKPLTKDQTVEVGR